MKFALLGFLIGTVLLLTGCHNSMVMYECTNTTPCDKEYQYHFKISGVVEFEKYSHKPLYFRMKNDTGESAKNVTFMLSEGDVKNVIFEKTIDLKKGCNYTFTFEDPSLIYTVHQQVK